jgi:PhoPQ-activated pathogenicity-related protein
MNLMGFLNLPVFEKLLHIIDPLTYLPEMARIPKYVIVAAGDEVCF